MSAHPNRAEKSPNVGAAVFIYVIALLAALLAWRVYTPTGPLLIPIVGAPAAALAWLIHQSRRRLEAAGGVSPAMRTYSRRFTPMIIAYVLLLCGVTWAYGHVPIAQPLAWLLAVLPAIPLLFIIWAMARLLIDETDEYQRTLHVRQGLIATGFTLAVTTVWGFLEQFGQVPHVPAFWVFVLWCVGLGLGSWVNKARS